MRWPERILWMMIGVAMGVATAIAVTVAVDSGSSVRTAELETGSKTGAIGRAPSESHPQFEQPTLDSVTDADPTYNMTRLLWVGHQPLQRIADNDPILSELGFVSGDDPPVAYRVVEGDALGIGQGTLTRFPYLPAIIGTRSQIIEQLRGKYPELIVLDESNGQAGETHVAHLRKGLSVAFFGTWHNPWSVSVVSSADAASQDSASRNEWAALAEGFAGAIVDKNWLLRAAQSSDEVTIDDEDARHSVWVSRERPMEMLVFSVTSLHSPVRIGLAKED